MMTELFEQVLLTAEEQLVYEALQTIEPIAYDHNPY